MTVLDKRFLEVRGSPFEMGLQQGQAFRESWGEVMTKLRQVPLLPLNLQQLIPISTYEYFFRAAGKRHLKRHQKRLKSFRGAVLLEKLLGLSEGFGKDLEDLYGVNSFEIDAAKVYFAMGCTSLVFSAQHTESGQSKIGYNHDFPASFGSLIFVRRSRPTKGLSSLSLTYPTLLGAIAGINEKGLAVTLNHAFAADFQDQEAIPITFLVQECLENCATAQEALDLIGDVPVPNGSMITFLDKSGDRRVIELACQKRATRVGRSEVMYTFNHYLMESMWSAEVPLEAKPKGLTKLFLKGRGIHEPNIKRENRLLELLEDGRKYSDEDIIELLSDHDDSRGDYHTICRHHPTTMSTIASTILNPESGSMRVSFESPCKENWTEYSLH